MKAPALPAPAQLWLGRSSHTCNEEEAFLQSWEGETEEQRKLRLGSHSRWESSFLKPRGILSRLHFPRQKWVYFNIAVWDLGASVCIKL